MRTQTACMYCGKGLSGAERYWLRIMPANLSRGPYHFKCAFEAKTDIEIGHTIAPLGVAEVKVSVLLEIQDR